MHPIADLMRPFYSGYLKNRNREPQMDADKQKHEKLASGLPFQEVWFRTTYGWSEEVCLTRNRIKPVFGVV